MKTCAKCSQPKSFSEYNKGNGADGLHSWCKTCCKEYNSTAERVEARRAHARKAYLRHPERFHKRKRAYRASILGRSLQLLDNARLRAERLGVPFSLTREWIAERLSQPCALTGRQFDLSKPADGVRANPNAPSIDRIENAKGYTTDNVRLVTVHANVARNEFSDADLVALARDIIRTISSQAPDVGEGSTTRAEARRDQAVPKRTAPQEGDDIVSSLQ